MSSGAPRSTTATWRPAGAWSTSPAGRCRCSTRAASSPSTWRRAGRPACSTSPTWDASSWAGAEALPFLQHVLTNNAAALERLSGAVHDHRRRGRRRLDDAYLYRFAADEYLLVVNASNRLKDWEHFAREAARFTGLELRDATAEIAMIALQGPCVAGHPRRGDRPRPAARAAAQRALRGERRRGATVRVGRTGYTGEPLCFELFVDARRRRRVVGRPRGRRGCAGRPRRARHPAPRSRPAALRLRARPRLRRPRDPDLRHLSGQARGELLAPQGRVRGARRSGPPARRLRPHRGARLRAARRPAAPRPAAGRGGPRRGAQRRAGLPGRAPGGTGDERHLGALLGGGR